MLLLVNLTAEDVASACRATVRARGVRALKAIFSCLPNFAVLLFGEGASPRARFPAPRARFGVVAARRAGARRRGGKRYCNARRPA